MAILWFFIVLVGGVVVAAFEYENETSLFKLSQVSGVVTVLRDDQFQYLEQDNLVPGDIVVLKPGVTYCDMVLLQGSHIVVDESALTGESAPVSKAAIDAQDDTKATYNTTTHKRQTILAGTTIVECLNDNHFGLVMKTGSYTSRGELVRDMITFQRHKFKFDIEVQLVVCILATYGIIAFILTGFVLIIDSWIYGWFYGIYVLAAIISALLPTVFVVSVGVAQKRLIKRHIACIKPENILVAGKVNVAFFDKTGTLTKQGLEFLSARGQDGSLIKQRTHSSAGLLTTGMACCHTLVVTCEGILIGNNLDKIMFEATGAKMESPSDVEQDIILVTKFDGEIFTVIKRFDFDHERMTQSVIVQNQNGQLFAFVKGSAESIKSICHQDSLPLNFDTTVENDAREGIYQISMAAKEIDSPQISRSVLECGLTFLGFIDFKNMLRAETSEVLRQLEDSKVRCVMVTGDSILTGIHVAKECSLIKCKKVLIAMSIDEEGDIIWVDELDNATPPPRLESRNLEDYSLAMSGAVWDHILSSDYCKALELIEHVSVFGRCTPGNKVSLISAMNSKGYITSMCGDGGNDCGALKTAHVGIALSDAEASMVASFTSIDKAISSVIEVLKEGRCALASAFASYKYMIMYGQVEAINQMVTAYFQVTFAQWNWVFMDGFWVVSMAFSLPLAKAAAKLSVERPTASLLGPHTMFSACGVLALNFVFMVISLVALFHQGWYQCRKWDSTDVSDTNVIGDNYEAQTLFIVTGYQYISSAMAFNFGYTFRSSWITNYVFVILALGWTIIQFYITLVPGNLSCFFRVNCANTNIVRGVTTGPMPIKNHFNTTIMPVDFRWILISIMVSNTIVIMGYEYFIVNGLGKRRLRRKEEHLIL